MVESSDSSGIPEDFLRPPGAVDGTATRDAGEETRPAPEPDAADPMIGQSVGPYRVLELLGRGGMGVVFLAEQSEPIRRRVALKIIKLGMDTKEVVARFEAERQALAMMDHPNIARV